MEIDHYLFFLDYDWHLHKLENPVQLKLTNWFWRRLLKLSWYFIYLSLFGKMLPHVALYSNKLEHVLPWNALCQVWKKLGQWFWREWFWLCRQFIIAIQIFLSPFGVWPFIWKKTPELPFTHECFVPLVEIGPVVLVKKKKMLSKKLQTNKQIYSLYYSSPQSFARK